MMYKVKGFLQICAALQLLQLLESTVVAASQLWFNHELDFVIHPFTHSKICAVVAVAYKAMCMVIASTAALNGLPGSVCASQWAAMCLRSSFFWLLIHFGIVNMLYWHKHPLNPRRNL
jgi:hypothetical protein